MGEPSTNSAALLHPPDRVRGALPAIDPGRHRRHLARWTCAVGSVLWLALRVVGADEASLNYPMDTVIPRTSWSLDTWGAAGESRWDGTRWTLDFRNGADAVMLRFPDRTLPGVPKRIRVKIRGNVVGHPVTLTFRTHFMTFSKVLGEFGGDGDQVLETGAPPGEGWTWSDGENDGKLHGPLRPGELRFAAAGHRDEARLESVNVEIEATSPADKRLTVTAQAVAGEDGGPVAFVAEARAFSAEPIEGALRWTVRNWDGQVSGEGRRGVTLPKALGLLTERVPSPVLPDGCRFAEAEFALEVPGQSVAPAQAYWLKPPEPARDAVLRPDSPFGMGVYLNRFSSEEMARVAQWAGDAGVKWSREDFSWGSIEIRPGEYRWDFHDRLLSTAEKHGITVYAIVAYFPDWSKGYTQAGVDQYVNFLRALVRRYRGRINHWEIWNEPNIFFWQGPRELYADLLIRSHAAVKEEAPEAQVLGLSTAGIDFEFINQMLAKGTPFDVLTIHPYRKQLDDAAFVADLKKASESVRLKNGATRPVWITEMGFATHVPHPALGQDFAPNTQRAQAGFLARAYLDTIVSGVEPRTFWYDFRNDGDDPFYFEHNMGIIDLAGRPKPAYLAFATMTAQLRGLQFRRARTDLGDVFAAEFGPSNGGKRHVLALWSGGTARSVEVPSAGRSEATVVNTIGEGRPLGAREGAFRFQVPANAPVYLVTE
jgi:hypothetical protein